jgi:hypothetical protein
MYRLLRALGESRERRAQRQHPRYAMPRLVAAAVRRQLFWPIALTHDFWYRVDTGCLT